ncbi:hypothetical protein DUNSADRAFT_3393 [Dunaliella salina]|uniref:Uncharacterized protein n=1 Tax=Dunaliella salina TaxID=3046 RepID=A0ABQ7FVF9_DUNSA|nr:hypothetical protein DUNSADRAFT_3393 [Dunaliella salina]|eukprot:KAF5826363.1 hypothetical protein DUNSADRAFT_3393 [Dunaliella salina]
MQQKHRTESDAWGKQADTLNLRCKQAERREQQLETKLRQQAAEAEGLRAKLRAALQVRLWLGCAEVYESVCESLQAQEKKRLKAKLHDMLKVRLELHGLLHKGLRRDV